MTVNLCYHFNSSLKYEQFKKTCMPLKTPAVSSFLHTSVPALRPHTSLMVFKTNNNNKKKPLVVEHKHGS